MRQRQFDARDPVQVELVLRRRVVDDLRRAPGVARNLEVGRLDLAERAAVRAQVMEALAPFQGPGGFDLPAVCLVASAR